MCKHLDCLIDSQSPTVCQVASFSCCCLTYIHCKVKLLNVLNTYIAILVLLFGFLVCGTFWSFVVLCCVVCGDYVTLKKVQEMKPGRKFLMKPFHDNHACHCIFLTLMFGLQPHWLAASLQPNTQYNTGVLLFATRTQPNIL